MNILATDFEFIGSSNIGLGLNLALAFDCDDGWGGMKFPFTDIRLTSDSQYNDTLPAGDDLMSLLAIRTFDMDGRFLFQAYRALAVDSLEAEFLAFRFPERPTVDTIHQLTMTLSKSNDDVITVPIETIAWE